MGSGWTGKSFDPRRVATQQQVETDAADNAERAQRRLLGGYLKLFAGRVEDLARTCSLLSRSESKPATDLSSRSASS